MPDSTVTQPTATAANTSVAPVEGATSAISPPAGPPDALTPANIKTVGELKKEVTRITDARSALQRERDAFQKERDEWRAREALLAVDPDAYLKPKLGDKWYETLTKAKLGDDSNLAVQQLRNEVESRFRAQQEAEAAKAAEEKQRYDEEQAKATEEARVAIEEFRTEATEFVNSKPDEYQTLHALKLEGSVAEKAQTHFQQTKKVLSHKEAADLLEAELDKAIESALGTKKWQEKLGKKAEVAKPPGPPQLVRPQHSTTTLDNGMRAGAAPQLPQRLTKEQKYERALAKLSEWEAEKAKAP